jgi:hypothetical protein
MCDQNILAALAQIQSDLIDIKRRLGIGNPDQFNRSSSSDSGTDRDIFFQDCTDLEIDIDGLDEGSAARSIDYYCLNRWRITNRKAYLEKLVRPHILVGLKKRMDTDVKPLPGYRAVSDAEVDRVLPHWGPELLDNIRTGISDRFNMFTPIDGVYSEIQKRVMIKLALSKDAISLKDY